MRVLAVGSVREYTIPYSIRIHSDRYLLSTVTVSSLLVS